MTLKVKFMDQNVANLQLTDIIRAIKSEIEISGEVTIKWCDDAEIQELNYQFRGFDKPTNVLSFPDESDDYLGDIAISLDTIEREAAEQGKTFEAHLAHMMVHGVLHLAGYDHENDQDAELMEKLEVAILEKLSIINPYE